MRLYYSYYYYYFFFHWKSVDGHAYWIFLKIFFSLCATYTFVFSYCCLLCTLLDRRIVLWRVYKIGSTWILILDLLNSFEGIILSDELYTSFEPSIVCIFSNNAWTSASKILFETQNHSKFLMKVDLDTFEISSIRKKRWKYLNSLTSNWKSFRFNFIFEDFVCFFLLKPLHWRIFFKTFLLGNAFIQCLSFFIWIIEKERKMNHQNLFGKLSIFTFHIFLFSSNIQTVNW